MTRYSLRNIRNSGLFLLMLLFLVNCKKESEPIRSANDKPGHIPGVGEASGLPEGTQFALPKGIKLIGAIVGEENGPDNGQCVYDGSGFWVNVTMTLRNDSISSSVTVEFPPGLVITSLSEGFQHGLLLEQVLVTLPPKENGGPGQPCQVTLMLSCLNASRHPSSAEASYKLGPVTSSALLKDFIYRLSGKKTKYSEYQGSDLFFENQEYVQDALWSITDGDGLTDTDLKHISQLPDK